MTACTQSRATTFGATGLAIQSDGKIVAGGDTGMDLTNSDVGSSIDEGCSLAVQTGGMIVVAGGDNNQPARPLPSSGLGRSGSSGLLLIPRS
jgi:hypothetical protein